MMYWGLGIHILLCIAAIALCIKAKETKKVLVFALCCIPFIGPILIVWAFVYYNINKLGDNNVHIQDQG